MKITVSRNEREGHFAGKCPRRKTPYREHGQRYQLRNFRYRAERAADEAHDWASYWGSR